MEHRSMPFILHYIICLYMYSVGLVLPSTLGKKFLLLKMLPYVGSLRFHLWYMMHLSLDILLQSDVSKKKWSKFNLVG